MRPPDFRTVDVDSFDWIFFDCFNTLIEDTDDSGEAYGFCGVWQASVDMGIVETVKEAGDRYRTWRLKRRQSDDAWREASLDERLHAIIGDAHWRSTVLEQLRMTWFRNFPLQTGAITGVPTMLAHWQQRKKLAVVSNFYVAGYPQEALERGCLLPYLHLVIDSAQVGVKKPDARMYQAALDKAQVSDPSRVLFIGDNWNNDVIGPRALGMQVAWFARSGEAPKEPAEVPVIRAWDAFR